jgi:hypothetical protein
MSYKVEQELSNSSGMIVVSYSPVDNDETEAADQEISDLLNEGWKIVSTCPVTGSIFEWTSFRQWTPPSV